MSKLIFLLLFISIGCSTSKHQNIYVLDDEFQNYWAKAKAVPDKNVKRHVELFKKYALKQGVHNQFYLDTVLANKVKDQSKVDIDKKIFNILSIWVAVFRKYENKIISEFSSFRERVKTQSTRFSKLVPDFQYQGIPIYGFLSLGNSLGGTRTHKGKTILIFGMDQLVKNGADFDILFSHEAYHAYHFQTNKTLNQQMEKSQRLLISMMYVEGLATYAAGQLNPEKYEHRYLDDSLKKACQGDTYKKYISEFLEDSKKFTYKDYEKKNHLPEKWFYINRKKKYPFPEMMGYCMGERVLNELGKMYSLSQMANWSLNVAHEKMIGIMIKLK
jgi:hypothetical protein